MRLASVISIVAYLGLFGEFAQAFSAFIALFIAFISAPLIAWFTRGRYYIARDRNAWGAASPTDACCICGNHFEIEDNAYCPIYQGTICSLCCTLDARCRDGCKPEARLEDQLQRFANRLLPKSLAPDQLTLEEAAQLIDERAAKGPPAKKGRGRKAPAKKKAAKK